MSRSAPWMKFWPADFMMETQHLTPAEVGHHVRLLCLAWRRANCAIPHDRRWIQRRLGVSDDEYEREVAPVLFEFWPEEGDHRVNENLRLAYSDMMARSEMSRKAALARHHGPNVHPLKRQGN